MAEKKEKRPDKPRGDNVKPERTSGRDFSRFPEFVAWYEAANGDGSWLMQEEAILARQKRSWEAALCAGAIEDRRAVMPIVAIVPAPDGPRGIAHLVGPA